MATSATITDYNDLYLDVNLIDAPLWWHEQGLQETASGYGRKLTTRYKVPFNGRNYRVYCTQIGNVGSLWFTAEGQRYYLT